LTGVFAPDIDRPAVAQVIGPVYAVFPLFSSDNIFTDSNYLTWESELTDQGNIPRSRRTKQIGCIGKIGILCRRSKGCFTAICLVVI
jgi:hypothetical protein